MCEGNLMSVYTNRETNLSEIDQDMEYLENSKKESPLPSVEVDRSQTRGPYIIENPREDYSNAFNHFINWLS